MCYEFDELYRKAREEELQRRKAQERKEAPAPAKPAPETQPREPVPA